MNLPFLLIPIETKVREFHAKLLLSCFAAEAGFKVILGDQDEIQRKLRYLPRGIYLDKSVAPAKAKSFKKIIDLGSRVVSWCEEGLVFLDPETYLRERVSVEAYKMVDAFFAWGQVQADTIRRGTHEATDKIVCTGNPRFDLLRSPYRQIFASEADKIRADYGSFILINTNFSRYNHYYGRDFVIRTMKAQGKLRGKEDEAFVRGWADYLGKMFQYFIGMVSHLGRSFPERSIIVRPHPAESQTRWREEVAALPNARVVQEGNVIPWIMASEVMIHNGCTTGVEAYLLGEPVLCYCPITSSLYDSELPNALSTRATSVDELTALVKRALGEPPTVDSGQDRNPDPKALANTYLSGTEGPMASENIVAVLSEVAQRNPQLLRKEDYSWARGLLMKFEDRIILGKRALRRAVKGRSGGASYQKQKFPGLTLAEIRQIGAQFRRLTDRFGDFDMQVVPNTKSCYLIQK